MGEGNRGTAYRYRTLGTEQTQQGSLRGSLALGGEKLCLRREVGPGVMYKLNPGV